MKCLNKFTPTAPAIAFVAFFVWHMLDVCHIVDVDTLIHHAF